MKRYVLTSIITVCLWLYAGARLALDIIGWSTAPDDIVVAVSRADQLFQWLMSIPVWLPFMGAVAATLALVMIPISISGLSPIKDKKAAQEGATYEQRLSSLYMDIVNTKKSVTSDLSRVSGSTRLRKVVYSHLSVRVAAQTRSVLARLKDFDTPVPTVGTEISLREGEMLVNYFETILPFVGRNQLDELKLESSEFIKKLGRLCN